MVYASTLVFKLLSFYSVSIDYRYVHTEVYSEYCTYHSHEVIESCHIYRGVLFKSRALIFDLIAFFGPQNRAYLKLRRFYMVDIRA
jgi:hypothetical protein